jgi:hypothetical protein
MTKQDLGRQLMRVLAFLAYPANHDNELAWRDIDHS